MLTVLVVMLFVAGCEAAGILRMFRGRVRC